MNKLIYLASPYTHEDTGIMAARSALASEFCAMQFEKGVHILSPVVHSHSIAVVNDLPRGFDFWMEWNLNILSRCDELWVLMISGWRESKGVSAEIKFATDDVGILTRYFQIDGTEGQPSDQNKFSATQKQLT